VEKKAHRLLLLKSCARTCGSAVRKDVRHVRNNNNERFPNRGVAQFFAVLPRRGQSHCCVRPASCSSRSKPPPAAWRRAAGVARVPVTVPRHRGLLVATRRLARDRRAA